MQTSPNNFTEERELADRNAITSMKAKCRISRHWKTYPTIYETLETNFGNTQVKIDSCGKNFLFPQEVTPTCKSLLCFQRCFPYEFEDILISICPEIISQPLILS